MVKENWRRGLERKIREDFAAELVAAGVDVEANVAFEVGDESAAIDLGLSGAELG